jgi:thiosulfate/3-mercaptopyruvate sulfurtransferase
LLALEPAPELQEPSDGDRPDGATDSREGDSSGKKSAMLIEPAALQERLKQDGLRVLDTRAKEEYAESHVPGAVWVDVKAWQEQGKRPGGFQDASAWAEKVARVGVGADSRVIVYGNRLSDTARIWWLHEYVGVTDVVILDGGWDLWTREGRPAESAVPAITPTRFAPRFDADRLAELDPLKDLLGKGGVTVVDARSEEEFTGTDVRGKRGGRIPGATHLEWKELVAADGRFKSVPDLQELFRQRGILPSETAVCY